MSFQFSKWALHVLLFAIFCRAQRLESPPPKKPDCIQACLQRNTDCQTCVRTLSEMLNAPKQMNIPFHKAHDGIPDPAIALIHHDFMDRPPFAVPTQPHSPHPPLVDAEGKTHKNCPAMKARSKVTGITLHMPYTVRFYRGGKIEFDCHWIQGTPTHTQLIAHPVDSPWIRLPRTKLMMFTVGDSRADVWILNSGIYIDDTEYMSSTSANPADKGGAIGNKWLVVPVPHKLQSSEWRIEQGVLSSFLRTAKNANIPLQLNFSNLPDKKDYIEIIKGTPMMQYVPALLPSVTLTESVMPKDTEDYLVLLSKIHNGGDYRLLGAHDKGAYDVMQTYQLKKNDKQRTDKDDRPGHRRLRQSNPANKHKTESATASSMHAEL
eukprot:m.186591 g.186591  ORF g.186591 m.186591 type:complete len:378 (-) comp15592_c0_seq15:1425-2558(-)